MSARKSGRGAAIVTAFTLVELLVVIGIIAVLIGILLPVLSVAQESSRRVKCASNLRQFGQGLLAYSSANNGQFPRVAWDRAPATMDTTNLVLNESGRKATNPFVAANIGTTGDDNTTGLDNVPASIFLLLRGRYLTPEVLLCPSQVSSNIASPDTFFKKDSALQRSNFSTLNHVSGPTNLSYSIQVMYPHSLAVKKGWVWDTSFDAENVLAADLNPGAMDLPTGITLASGFTYDAAPDVIETMNSRNHRALRGKKEGQNVLYGDYHVEFQRTPYCGALRSDLTAATDVRWRDNIYTANVPVGGVVPQNEMSQAADQTAKPAAPHDTILLPAADPAAAGGAQLPPEQ